MAWKTHLKNQFQHSVANGLQDIKYNGIEAPKYSKGTEDYGLKDEVQHKRK